MQSNLQVEGEAFVRVWGQAAPTINPIGSSTTTEKLLTTPEKNLYNISQYPNLSTCPDLSNLSDLSDLSALIQTYPNLSELIRTYPYLSALIRTYPNLSELIRTYPNPPTHQQDKFKFKHPSPVEKEEILTF